MTTRTLLKIFFLPFIIVLSVVLLCHFKEIPPNIFTSDPLVLVGAYPWLGLISNLGVLVWTVGAGICFFASAVLSRNNDDREYVRFLAIGGIIGTLLTLDDLFMLHEYIYPDFLHIPQNFVYVVYAAGFLWYLIKFRMLIWKTGPLLFVLSLVFFALSTACDLLLEAYKEPWFWFWEDVPKFFGIVSWTAYFATFSFKALVTPKTGKPKTN